ncbi:MAG: hypothetical protein H6Q89_663 [Myxococcaceae bacterium]|nr:hypothetical protein [Myxococcaceae bacterium]
MLPIALMLLAAAPSSSDAVKALITTQAEAWNRGDLPAFTRVYADDAIFVSPSGVTRGRQSVLERYQKRYPDKKAMGTLSFEFVETRETKDGVSLVAKWTLAYPDKPAATGHTLLVLHQKGDRWLIVQDASM